MVLSVFPRDARQTLLSPMQVLTPGAHRTRHMRKPNFAIAGVMRPFGLYPIVVHPVLPGETLKSANTRWRVISMPVKHPLCGCWLESWLFYVKLTDIDRELGQMFVSDTFSTTGYTAAANQGRYFTKAGQINWVEQCMTRIADSFFRNENEVGRTIDGVPMAKLNVMSWYQNMMFRPAEVAVDTTSPVDMDAQLKGWQMLQQMQMTELTYEKYLEQYGVQSMKLGIGEPEILRYTRSWTQPASHVNPATGTPSSAWAWSDEMKAEKEKRFDEPGFILQVACVRPKMFQAGLLYSMVGNLWGFTDWFPAYNLSDPTAGVRTMPTTDPVFNSDLNGTEAAVDLLYDHRDLLAHGEQFVNSINGSNPYPLPYARGLSLLAAADAEDVRGEYCLSTDIDSLFVGTTEQTRYCYYEGITQMIIAGHVTDTTR
nr:MAG: major capsid protein [Microvirus sp.]